MGSSGVGQCCDVTEAVMTNMCLARMNRSETRPATVRNSILPIG